MNKKARTGIFFTAVVVLITKTILWSYKNTQFSYAETTGKPFELEEAYETEYPNPNFNNEIPASVFLVPNLVHYIRFNNSEYSFLEYLCIRSAYLHHQPTKILIHTNVLITGFWWRKIQEERAFFEKITIKPIQLPTFISGPFIVRHASDYCRIQLLSIYGGIYLDNDMFIVQNLDYFRRFEMTVPWDEGVPLANGMMISGKNARFLKLYNQSYADYIPTRYYYNAGEFPTYGILYKNPSLVHRVKLKFGVHWRLPSLIYTKYWPEWKYLHAIHLGENNRLDKDNLKKFGIIDETNIFTFNKTLTLMAESVLPLNITSAIREYNKGASAH